MSGQLFDVDRTGAGLVRADALAFPLADETVDLVVTSPPYFALRSYQDDGEHYDGQLGSEATPVDFLLGQWAVLDECWRTLKPGGSVWFNYGDKYAGSGGHNNSAISAKSTLKGNGHVGGGPKVKATRRSAPDRYNQTADVRAKSLMGLPWRFALGAVCPQLYRAPLEPSACWHDDGPRCLTCPPRQFPQWIGRAEVVWSKPNGLPESVTDRVRRSHETWFHLVKSSRYFAAVDEVRETYSDRVIDRQQYAGRRGEIPPSKVNPDRLDGRGAHGILGFGSDGVNPLGRLPGSVWSIPSEPLQVPEHVGVDHFAAFPQEWPRRIILGWSPSGICTACGEGRRPVVEKEARVQAVRSDSSQADAATASAEGRSGFTRDVTWMGSTEATITGYACACPDTSAPTRPAVVLDPFGGTGTTAMVARALGRHGVHLDLSADYLRLARWRVFESGHWRKTTERADEERRQREYEATTGVA